MATRTLMIEHDGETYQGHTATIKSTTLGYESHGILSAYVHLEWPGAGVSVGGYCLDRSTGSPNYDRVGTAYGLDHIIRLMEVVGVASWEALTGSKVIVLFPATPGGSWGHTSVGLANLLDESKVFILKAHAEVWLGQEAEAV